MSHQRRSLATGNIWYGDFSFPHRVFYTSERPRVHIMFDVTSSDMQRAKPSTRHHDETARRAKLRSVIAPLMSAYNRVTPSGRKAFRIRIRTERDRAYRTGKVVDVRAVK